MEEITKILKYVDSTLKEDQRPCSLKLYADQSGQIITDKGNIIFEFGMNGGFYKEFFKYFLKQQ